MDVKIVLEEIPFSEYLNVIFHTESWSRREGYGRRVLAVCFRKTALNYLMSVALLEYPFALFVVGYNLWEIYTSCCTLASEFEMKSDAFIHKGHLVSE